MNFRRFITALADRIGQHQIPVDSEAAEIRYFLGHDAVHHDFITALVRSIYRKNGCGHLDASIDPHLTMKTIAGAREGLVRAGDTDICQYRFVDALCHEARQLLLQSIKNDQHVNPPPQQLTRNEA